MKNKKLLIALSLLTLCITNSAAKTEPHNTEINSYLARAQTSPLVFPEPGKSLSNEQIRKNRAIAINAFNLFNHRHRQNPDNIEPSLITDYCSFHLNAPCATIAKLLIKAHANNALTFNEEDSAAMLFAFDLIAFDIKIKEDGTQFNLPEECQNLAAALEHKE
jgi:hypothetical protein